MPLQSRSIGRSQPSTDQLNAALRGGGILLGAAMHSGQRRFLLAASFGLLLTGCSEIESSQITLEPSGPYSAVPSNKVDGASGSNLVGNFEHSYIAAERDQQKISDGWQPPQADPAPAAVTTAPATAAKVAAPEYTDSDTNYAASRTAADVSNKARQMALDGMNLVDAYCADFFRRRGDSETVLSVIKDSTTAGASAASGVLSLASPANSVASGAISLFTATTSDVTNIYTKNFLFGSDNIESVRAMTMTALSAHRSKIFPTTSDGKDADTTPWNFGDAVNVIMDHQDICTPASIRTLVLSSISTTKFTTAPVTTTSAEKSATPTAPGRHYQVQVLQ
jgi:hypothetical protein